MQIGITLVAINGLFLAALVVAFLYLNDTRLTTAITAITAVQVVRIVSQLASSRLPDAAQDILQVLSLVMLDFKFIRPGCVAVVAILSSSSLLCFGVVAVVVAIVVVLLVPLSPSFAPNRVCPLVLRCWGPRPITCRLTHSLSASTAGTRR